MSPKLILSRAVQRGLQSSGRVLMTFEGNARTAADDNEEKISNVFGGRIKGDPPRSTSRVVRSSTRDIAGIAVPEKPVEPDNCCMSGCVNCVWEIYNEDLRDWKNKRKEAAHRLKGTNLKWPADFNPPLGSLDIQNVPSQLKAAKIKLDKLKSKGTASLFPPRTGKLPQSVLDAKKRRKAENQRVNEDSEDQDDKDEGWDNVPMFIRVFAEFEKKKKLEKQTH